MTGYVPSSVDVGYHAVAVCTQQPANAHAHLARRKDGHRGPCGACCWVGHRRVRGVHSSTGYTMLIVVAAAVIYTRGGGVTVGLENVAAVVSYALIQRPKSS